MNIAFTASAAEITDALYNDMESGDYYNSYGERISEYHAFIRDEDGNGISIQATEERVELTPDEYFYSVHLVDAITGKDCELFSSDEQTKESLLLLVYDIMKSALNDVIKTWDDLNVLYPMARHEMTEEQEKDFVERCFSIYESNGFFGVFWSPYEDHHADYYCKKYEIVRRCTTKEMDMECLPAWIIKFDDGFELTAYPEEIVYNEMVANGFNDYTGK